MSYTELDMIAVFLIIRYREAPRIHGELNCVTISHICID